MDFGQTASKETIVKTMAAAIANGFTPQFVETAEEALVAVKKLIPDGATVMTGGSRTLEEIGFTELLVSGSHPWNNLKAGILAEKDPAKQMALRKQAVLAQYYLGSVHALTEDGRILDASGTGSQLGPYAYTADNLIWVIGAQKIVPTLADGFERVEKYVFPLEDQRQKDLGAPGTTLSKILQINKETSKTRKVHMIIVNQKLGF